MKKKLISFILSILFLSFGLLAPVGLLEVALRLGFRANDLNWTPPEATIADDLITTKHLEVSALHPHGFNDKTVDMQKPPGIFRIAVLSDSFVWGDGVNDEERWTRKLEKLLNEKNKNYEVLHWGLRGWSTADHVNFLKENAAKWNLDYLIIGFTSNDPDVKLIPQKHVIWNGYQFPREMAKVFPYSARFIFGYLSQLINERIPGWGYDYWEEKLYSEENLAAYKPVVRELKQVCDQLKIPVTIVFVPSSWYKYFEEKFNIVIPIFRAEGFSTFNLYPDVHKKLSHIPLADLRANRADGHPGDKITEVYAQSVFDNLQKLYHDASGMDLPQ